MQTMWSRYLWHIGRCATGNFSDEDGEMREGIFCIVILIVAMVNSDLTGKRTRKEQYTC